ncbi:MAG: hypothetical protein J5J06_04395 [Phycisphaerae bacterium]|nr:hypothetical protein [Phycisphaerae bacterium]
MSREPRLATLVTARSAVVEPYHRWIPYRQGFSPELVRTFIREEGDGTRAGGGGTSEFSPLLDPFSGSGTFVVECARRGIVATGVEPLRTLVFLNEVMSQGPFPPLPALPDSPDWRDYAIQLREPLHHAALMLAVARQYTGKGKLNRGAEPIGKLLHSVAEMMREDLTMPLRRAFAVHRGDARRLDMFEEESMAGVLTSPPYVSRYDYVGLTGPYEQVYSFWYGPDESNGSDSQIEAVRPSPFAVSRSDYAGPSGADSNDNNQASRCEGWGEPGAAAAEEVCEELLGQGKRREARLVGKYLNDLARVFDELLRVLRVGAPCWIVVGGARISDAYFPADLHVAELAEVRGLDVDGIFVARDLVPTRHRFGDLGLLAPRESVIALRKVQARPQ